MDVFIRKVADKKLRALPPKLEQSIREAVNKIAEDPKRTDLDIRPFRDNLAIGCGLVAGVSFMFWTRPA